MVVFILW